MFLLYSKWAWLRCTRPHTRTHKDTHARTHTVSLATVQCSDIFYITHRRETHLPRQRTVRTGITYKHTTEFLLMHAIGNILKQDKMRHTYTHTLLHTHSCLAFVHQPTPVNAKCTAAEPITHTPLRLGEKNVLKHCRLINWPQLWASAGSHTHNLTHTYPCVRTSTKNLVSFQRSESIRHKKKNCLRVPVSWACIRREGAQVSGMCTAHIAKSD